MAGQLCSFAAARRIRKTPPQCCGNASAQPAMAAALRADGASLAQPLFGGHADGLGFGGKPLAYQLDVSPEVVELI